MNVHYVIELKDEERAELIQFINSGTKRVRKVKRAQILLAAERGILDRQIAESLSSSTSTVYRTKKRFVEGGLSKALNDDLRPGGSRKLSGKEEAILVAITCSNPPPGRARWTLELLAGELVRLTEHTTISRETVRRRLSEQELKPWQQKMWCVPKIDAEYVACMEDILDLYAQSSTEDEPIVCFDESPLQLIEDKRLPMAAKPGTPQRIDHEYRRKGTVNLLVFVDVHRSWRHVKISDEHCGEDFAECMRDLVDNHYPKAKRIRVVLDNLSTHRIAALYKTFGAAEARRIARRIELHYVPKHASWLNMVEIEIGVLKSQCLKRRIGERSVLQREIDAWTLKRNASGACIRWAFTVEKAREKMGRVYPQPLQATTQAAA
jgi:transposase